MLRKGQKPSAWGFLFMVLFPGLALAHNLGMECRIKGNRIEVEAYYDNGDDAVGAKVRVINPQGKEVFLGKTDAKGLCFFSQPIPGKYQVFVETPGHRINRNLTVPDPWLVLGASTVGLAVGHHGPLCTAAFLTPGPEGQGPALSNHSFFEKNVSEDPTRQEFTRFPWEKLALGLGIIGSVSAAFLWARRKGRQDDRMTG